MICVDGNALHSTWRGWKENIREDKGHGKQRAEDQYKENSMYEVQWRWEHRWELNLRERTWTSDCDYISRIDVGRWWILGRGYNPYMTVRVENRKSVSVFCDRKSTWASRWSKIDRMVISIVVLGRGMGVEEIMREEVAHDRVAWMRLIRCLDSTVNWEEVRMTITFLVNCKCYTP